MSDKRPHSPDGDGPREELALVKRQRTGGELIVGTVTKDVSSSALAAGMPSCSDFYPLPYS